MVPATKLKANCKRRCPSFNDAATAPPASETRPTAAQYKTNCVEGEIESESASNATVDMGRKG
jgi:hypothetical protein